MCMISSFSQSEHLFVFELEPHAYLKLTHTLFSSENFSFFFSAFVVVASRLFSFVIKFKFMPGIIFCRHDI